MKTLDSLSSFTASSWPPKKPAFKTPKRNKSDISSIVGIQEMSVELAYEQLIDHLSVLFLVKFYFLSKMYVLESWFSKY